MAFAYYASVTVDHTKVVNTDQTSFPIFISGTYDGTASVPNLKSVANSGHVQSSSGFDVYFYSDSALTTRLPAERVAYNATTGKVGYWVQQTVSASVNTTIYIAYGDATISTDPNLDVTYGAAKVWDSHYKGVWHMNDNAATKTVVDSVGSFNGTSVVNNTSAMTDATSPLGYGLTFNGSSDYITTLMTTALGDFSVEMWYEAATAKAAERLVDKSYTGGFWTGQNAVTASASSFGGGIRESTSPYGIYVTLAGGSWHQLVMTRSSTTKTVRGDGGAVGTTATISSLATDATAVWFGNSNPNNATVLLNGKMGEVRISDIARSTDWFDTTYKSVNSPSTFYTMGSEISLSGNVSIAQVAANVTATGGTQTIVSVSSAAIAQSAATVTATGGTQAIATVNNVSISQLAATITATGGTQSIATVNNASIAQVAANVTATGGTQAITNSNFVSIAQVAGSVTASGGTQTLAAQIDAAIAQLAANVTATGGTQSVSATSGATNASITQTAATVTATGGVQIVSINSSPLPPHRDKSLILLTDGHVAVKVASGVYLPL